MQLQRVRKNRTPRDQTQIRGSWGQTSFGPLPWLLSPLSQAAGGYSTRVARFPPRQIQASARVPRQRASLISKAQQERKGAEAEKEQLLGGLARARSWRPPAAFFLLGAVWYSYRCLVRKSRRVMGSREESGPKSESEPYGMSETCLYSCGLGITSCRKKKKQLNPKEGVFMVVLTRGCGGVGYFAPLFAWRFVMFCHFEMGTGDKENPQQGAARTFPGV